MPSKHVVTAAHCMFKDTEATMPLTEAEILVRKLNLGHQEDS